MENRGEKEMKKLKYNAKKKEYTGVAYTAVSSLIGAQIIVVAPTMRILRKFYSCDAGAELNSELCKKLNVKITNAEKKK